MPLTRKLLFVVLALSLFTSAGWLMAGDKPSKTAATSSKAPQQMDENKRVLHALKTTPGVNAVVVEQNLCKVLERGLACPRAYGLALRCGF